MARIINPGVTAALLAPCCLALMLPFQLFAQETPEITAEIQALLIKDLATLTEGENAEITPYISSPSLASPQVDTLENTVNCFDFYRFGSVQVDLSPTLDQTVPGVPLTFTGELKNENSYPIVNGSVYVKIFKVGEEHFEHQNGYPLVAFFEAGKDIEIPASSTVPFTFDWQVPQALAGGDYEADFFFVTDHRFNLLGLSFTDDVTGNKTDFHITTDSTNQVVFDKHAVTFNENPYSFAAFPPHFDLDTLVTVAAPIVNPSNTEKTVTLTWQLYNWDGLREDFLLDTRSEVVTLKAEETKTVSYTAHKQSGAVSYVLATLTDGDATSILNPRFVHDNTEEVRLNFPSLTKFPLIAEEENTLFSCVHSTNLPLVAGIELIMTLTDTITGETIHTYTYEGSVTGAMMGVANKFTPNDNYGKVTLTTALKKNGEIIDVVTQSYDCNVLSPDNCPTKKQIINTSSDTYSSLTTSVAILFFVIVVAFFVIMQVLKQRNREDIIVTNPTKN